MRVPEGPDTYSSLSGHQGRCDVWICTAPFGAYAPVLVPQLPRSTAAVDAVVSCLPLDVVDRADGVWGFGGRWARADRGQDVVAAAKPYLVGRILRAVHEQSKTVSPAGGFCLFRPHPIIPTFPLP
jgi:hypothetical protein